MKKFFGSFFQKRTASFSLALLLLATLICTGTGAPAEDQVSAGNKLYNGGAKLVGVIAGQAEPMPASVLVCVNCHVGRPGQAGGDARAAPDLRRGWLRKRLSRRNGPAGRYTEAGFCRALRTGIDPLYVMLPVQMPRFTISGDDCAALWAYLDAPA